MIFIILIIFQLYHQTNVYQHYLTKNRKEPEPETHDKKNETLKGSGLMTRTYYTKDENIYFHEKCLDITEIKGIKTKVFHAFFTYTPRMM